MIRDLYELKKNSYGSTIHEFLIFFCYFFKIKKKLIRIINSYESYDSIRTSHTIHQSVRAYRSLIYMSYTDHWSVFKEKMKGILVLSLCCWVSEQLPNPWGFYLFHMWLWKAQLLRWVICLDQCFPFVCYWTHSSLFS